MATTIQLTPDQAANSDDEVSGKIAILKIYSQLVEYSSYWLKNELRINNNYGARFSQG